MVLTEDTGLVLEMALCIAFDTPYNGTFKYSMEEAQQLSHRFKSLTKKIPKLIHTARKGARYDFSGKDDPSYHLSAKSTKKDGKVAPQVIGQPSVQKFCELIGIKNEGIPAVKQYIQQNIARILKLLVHYTFDSTIVYYNKSKNSIRLISLIVPIDWDSVQYTWTRSYETWENSSTLRVIINEKPISILEIQFHNTRSNMAIRWSFENLLLAFKNNFLIENV